MTDGGFEETQFTEAPPLAATRRLVEGYEKASREHLSGLGFLYGTEVVDLQMVATIGALMKRSTGLRTMPWVDVHVAQEQGHVESSTQTLHQTFDHDEQHRVVTSAEEMWTLWRDFFKSVRQEILPN
jgi:pyrroloquinoline quinone (PQQ) biosynthesis protein C